MAGSQFAVGNQPGDVGLGLGGQMERDLGLLAWDSGVLGVPAQIDWETQDRASPGLLVVFGLFICLEVFIRLGCVISLGFIKRPGVFLRPRLFLRP